MAVYIIGGSPCSGKSTIASALSERYGLHYFKVDDHLDRYLKLGTTDKKPCCMKIGCMTSEQIWMRDPLVQCDEELLIYEEIFDYVMADLEKADCKEGVITEGAAYLPMLASNAGIPVNRYISLTPTKAFQVHHYRKREWVPYVLADCSDKEKAFANWMDRDALFAKAVQQQCNALGYASVIHDGQMTQEELMALVAVHFEL